MRRPLLSIQKCLFLFLIFLTPCSFAQYFTGPIGDLPDPHIVFHEGWYYFTGTTGSGVHLKKARTLEELKSVSLKQVFSSANGGPCCDYWAPELHRINNIWYIYYTANATGGIGNQRMYVIENTAADPTTGQWVNRGRLFDSSADFWAIDATVLQLNGQLYLIWSSVANASDGDKPQRLYIGKLTNPWTLQPGRVLLSSPDNAWERNGLVNEGPSILRRNGKVFLTFSGSGCWTPDYAIGMLYMNETSNPMLASSWTKPANPLFTKDPGRDAYGPGHHSFFTSPDGSEVWMVYHATTVATGACDNTRTTRAQKISFDANGLPVLGTPERTGVRLTAPSGEPAVPVKNVVLNGLYKIVPISSNKPLDIDSCSPAVGANVHQWDSHGGDCQKWHIQATTDGYYTIVSRRGGLAMDVQNCSTANAANVQMYSPSGVDCQKWSFEGVGNGNYLVRSKISGKVLDVQFGGSNNGANVQLYDYLANPQQQYRLELLESSVRVNPGTYEIISRKSGMALDLDSCGNTNGTNVKQWTRSGNDCQKWRVEDAGGGYYRIRAFINDRVIDVNGCSQTPGANVQVWDSYDNDCQKFSFVHVRDNYFSIINKSSGLALDVNGCSTTAGANVQQWTNWLGDCQQWRFQTPGVQFSLLREAESYNAMSGVQLEATLDPLGGGQNVGWINAGDWMVYNSITFPNSGQYKFEYRVASPVNGTALSLDLNAGAIQLGQVPIPNTGGWQNWTTVSQTVYIDAGTYNVGIFAATGDWNINWFKITSL